MRYHQFAGSIIGAASVVGASGSGSASAAPATPAEQRMIATVDAEQARTSASLERMVNQNSGSRNLEGVRKVRDIVSPEFTASGFAARWVPMEQTGRAGHS
ncbi:hypothetical protein OY671_012095, partial [Metschnikowia pulcherrima]